MLPVRSNNSWTLAVGLGYVLVIRENALTADAALWKIEPFDASGPDPIDKGEIL